MTDYTPTTEEVRDIWTAWSDSGGLTNVFRLYDQDPGDVFDRWLADRDRKIAEKAWDEGWDACLDCVVDGPDWGQSPPNPYRADRIEQGDES